MSLASERREAELERANYEKAVKAMRASGGTFSGGFQPGTFTMNGKTVVGQAAEGVYDMASLNKAAKTRPGGIDVTVNGTPMLYIHPDYRSNPGITWKNGDQANGFVDAAAMREAHPKSDDWVKSYGPAIVGGIAGAGILSGLGGATGAATSGGELLSGMDLAADAAVGSGNYIGGSNLGQGMGFFDDILGSDWYGDMIGIEPGSEVFSGGTLSNAEIMADIGFPELGGITSQLKNLLPGSLGDVSKLLLGGNAAGGSKGVADLFGDKGILGSAISSAPALAAINYAKNQDPFDTSRLESVYESINPGSVALPYDLETSAGRERLTSSLTDRGVTGSSFADHSMNSYNTLRDVGRSNLITGAAGTQANVASQILQAQIKEREAKNNLYGRALLALSGGLSGGRI